MSRFETEDDTPSNSSGRYWKQSPGEVTSFIAFGAILTGTLFLLERIYSPIEDIEDPLLPPKPKPRKLEVSRGLLTGVLLTAGMVLLKEAQDASNPGPLLKNPDKANQLGRNSRDVRETHDKERSRV
jgi:hypothetical protein